MEKRAVFSVTRFTHPPLAPPQLRTGARPGRIIAIYCFDKKNLNNVFCGTNWPLSCCREDADVNDFLQPFGMTMTNGLKKMLNPDDLEYLSFDQAASICCISEERFAKWIEKGLVPVIDLKGKQLIRSRDLVQHLVHHNIRIPDRLLQGNIKKILFILMQTEIPPAMTSKIIWALYRIKQQPSYIFDFIEFDATTELKIITFDPDVIFLLQQEADSQAAEQSISKMLGKNIPIHSFSVEREIDLDALLAD